MNDKQSAYSEEVQEVKEEQTTQGTPSKVKTLNRKVAYLIVGGLTLFVVLLLVVQSWNAERNRVAQQEAQLLAAQEKAVQVNTAQADKDAQAQLDAQARRLQQQEERAKKAEQALNEVTQKMPSQAAQDPVSQVQSIAAFRQQSPDAQSGQPSKGEAKEGEVDPWVAARKSFRAQEAQMHYQQRMAARSTPIFGGGGSPSDEGAPKQPQGTQGSPMQPAHSSGELTARLQAAQRPMAPASSGMVTYSEPTQPSPGAQGGIQVASLSAGDAHQEAFYHQGGKVQTGYKPSPGHTGRVDVQAGTVVHLALETGMSSELPGVIMARVTKPVYDPSLSYVSIPSGTRVIGTYNARVEQGQTRAQVSWTTLVWDGGGSMELGGLPGVDLGGQSGFEADVDNHFDKAFAGAALSGILSASASALAGPANQLNVDPRQQAINGAAQPFQESGETLSKQYLDLPPTLSLEPGAVVGMLVTHDLSL